MEDREPLPVRKNTAGNTAEIQSTPIRRRTITNNTVEKESAPVRRKTTSQHKHKKVEPKSKIVLRIIGRTLTVILTTAIALFIGAYSMLWIFCHGPSEAARDLFVSTIMETGQMKFLASWYFSEDEILEITGNNSMQHNNNNVDPDIIETPPVDDKNINDIQIEEISGRSFYGKIMIIKDPSRVKLATIFPWSDDSKDKYGQTLEELVTGSNAIAGINGGEYYSEGNWGGKPKGLVVCNGAIQYNQPETGDVMIGISKENKLIITDIGTMSSAQTEQLVKDQQIRDAVSFKDIDDGDSNHFTKLIINGKATEISGSGSGANPRTVIGQRADGAILMLVTDGRGASGHIGATAQDLINIMIKYGAVNAANLDGGSSSAMYYNGDYEMTSVTLYYSTSSWRLPTSFVVEKRGE